MTDNVVPSLLRGFPLILPEIVLAVTSCIVFLGGTVRASRHVWAGVSFFGIVLAFLFVPYANDIGTAEGMNLFVSPISLDALGQYTRLVALSLGALLVLLSWDQLQDQHAGDYFGCLLVVVAGLSLTGSANELVTLFLALELISIPTYIMLYLPKHDDASQEAALKYFMLSVFSSAILLFGFSYLYGLTGSTNISVLMHTLYQVQWDDSVQVLNFENVPMLSLIAVIMIIAGLGFKITAVPFHFYAPDVYQGTSTVMAALLAVVPKVAGFVALLRLFGFVTPQVLGITTTGSGTLLSPDVPVLLWFLAAITMTVGNVFALLQKNLRRLLAYSSIAHAGYMLIGLAATPYIPSSFRSGETGAEVLLLSGVAAVLLYLVAYALMTVGAFAVISYIDSEARPVETEDDLAGLARTHPVLAIMMVVFMFSLIGIPFTAGFLGKLMVFFSALAVGPEHATFFRALALIGMVNAAIGGWYYLRIITAMYLRTSIRPVEPKKSIPGFATILLCAVFTIGLSIPPLSTWFWGMASNAGSGTPSLIQYDTEQQ
ncbi:MAG: NADH-quinone oxidoreductase subunit N [Gemmataceae bacterium]